MPTCRPSRIVPASDSRRAAARHAGGARCADDATSAAGGGRGGSASGRGASFCASMAFAALATGAASSRMSGPGQRSHAESTTFFLKEEEEEEVEADNGEEEDPSSHSHPNSRDFVPDLTKKPIGDVAWSEPNVLILAATGDTRPARVSTRQSDSCLHDAPANHFCRALPAPPQPHTSLLPRSAPTSWLQRP